jgi:YVTN family beta-propeller protein
MALMVCGAAISAQSYTAPAGERPALRRSGPSILPGGRIVAPLGEEYSTGPGAFAIAVSASGKTVVTADSGPFHYSFTVLERASRDARWQVSQAVAPPLDATGQSNPAGWHGVSLGVALAGERGIYLAEGDSGRVVLFDSTAEPRRVFDLNQAGFTGSFTGDLALDAARGILYVADQANFRIAAIDVRSHPMLGPMRSRYVMGSVRVGRLPFAIALAPDAHKLYVANCGMFEYRALAGAPEIGLSFPAFGFPSAEAVRGVKQGGIEVPGLGEANAREADSVAVVDVTNPAAMKVEAFVRTGLDFGGAVRGASGPAGILAAAGRVFVSNANDDSISVIDPATNRVETEIPIRIPGLDGLRGVIPIGLAYHEASGWLLVAEAGLNAVGVIDVRERRVIGHLPAAWFPTRVALDGDTVFVANARGHGVGPNAPGIGPGGLLTGHLYQGTISVFHLPARDQLPAHTDAVLEMNGFRPRMETAPPLAPIRHVVLIVKESLSYDEVLGDIAAARNGPVMGDRRLARLGTRGFADGQRQRLSIKDVNLTPNHHALANRWASSDNFYADGEASVEGHHWLAGVYPNPWVASSVAAAYGGRKSFQLGSAPGRLGFAGMSASVAPEDIGEAGTLWDHLAAHAVSFLNFGEGFELAGAGEGPELGPTGVRLLTNIPMPDALFRNTSRQYPGFNLAISDQQRASQFIAEIETRYRKPGAALPALLFVHLPGDYLADARPDDGYPFPESHVADNDYALGRIVEYLSGTPWWRDMAIFVTEADTHGGVDHVDSHRTILLCAGPWAKPGYVSHRNVSFPGLLKTVFRLLQLPPLNLYDAAAADLTDCFAKSPDPARYQALPEDPRIFDPK